MSIKRINQFPDGSGTLTNDDVFLIMDNPSGSGITKTLSLSSLYGNISSGVIATIVDFAPATLNTLNEIAAAIGDNENFLNIVAYSGDNITKFVNDANYSVSGHTHTIANVSGLQLALDNKQPSGNYQASGDYALSSHTHTIANVSGLQLALDNKQPSGNYQASGDYALSSHTHPQLGGNLDLNTNNIVGTGNININGNITSASGSLSRLSFNTSVADPVLTQGQLSWDSTEGTLNLGITNTHAQHIGEELHYRVRNNSASTLLKGTAVYASGLTAGGSSRIEVLPFVADGSVREVKFMGLVTEDISTGINGYTTHYGHIHSLDTRGDATANGTTNKIWATGEPTWAAGDILYVHPTVAGKLTKIEPQHSISVAIILNRHQTQGKLFVRPISYGHLEDNHDVAISGATNGQFLQYNSATDYWVPSSSGNFTTLQVNGTGVSVSGHTHTVSNITDFNTGVSGLLPSTHPNVVQLGSVSGTINTNASLGDIFDLTLTASGTLANPTNPTDGQTIRWRISHNANSLVLNFGNQFRIPSSATSPLPLSSTSGNMDILGATYDSSRTKWDVIAFVYGY